MVRALVVSVVLAACGGVAAPSPVPSPLPVVELQYRVFEQVGRPWYCDPDFYPVARANEKDVARERLPEMQRDAETYAAILRHNGIAAGASLTDDQLLALYHDWKDLQRLELQPTGPLGVYGFTLVVRPPASDKEGERVEGRIDASGSVTVLRRQPAGQLMCPICLSAGTRIDTPRGPVLVTELMKGELVWTLGERGERLAAPILETASVEAPPGHEVVRIVLADDRAVTASPGHPTADGRSLGSLALGERLDGSTVVRIERLPYSGRTYDLLPAGPTGAYWADGVLLGSKLRLR